MNGYSSAKPDHGWDLPVPRKRYGAVLVVTAALWVLAYYGVNSRPPVNLGFSLMLPGEEGIARVSAAYPIYAAVYAQPLLPLLLAPNRFRYVELQLAMIVASLIAFSVFLLWPVAYPRPPLEVVTIFDSMLALEYSTDAPICTFPSLHVAFTWTVWLGLRDVSRRWDRALLLFAVSISVSTVLVKQHFIVDVLAGAALAPCALLVARAVMRAVTIGSRVQADSSPAPSVSRSRS